MTAYQDQNHYELLEVSPTASEAEIQAAVERSRAMFAEDSLAVYTLVDADEAGALRERIERAAATLLQADARDAYDQSLGLPPRPRSEEPVASPPVAAAAAEPPPPASEASSRPEPGLEVVTPEAPPPAPAPVALAPEPAPEESAPIPVPERPPEIAPPSSMTLAPRAPLQPVPPPAAEPPSMSVPTRVSALRPKGMDIPPDAEFNGELLRKVRESRGQTVAQIADRTRIGKFHLENVEADRYEALPAAVYLRGILMNLARELQLDPLRVAKSYLALVQSRRKPS